LDLINERLDENKDINDDLDGEFEFEKYLEDNNLDDLEGIGKFSKSHHLKIKSIPIKV